MKTTRLFLLTLLLALAGSLGMNAKEAYRALSYSHPTDGKTLLTITYFYDNERSSRASSVDAILNVDGLLENIPCADEVEIYFDNTFADYRPTNTNYWFNDVPARQKVTFYGWENLNTSQVTNMVGMFNGLGYYFDESTQSIGEFTVSNFDLSHFDTSKATDMTDMLNHVKVDELDLSNFIFSSGMNTTRFLANSNINYLVIPSSAIYWADDACKYLTGNERPCTISYPSDINPRVTYFDNQVVNGDCESDDVSCLWGKDGDFTGNFRNGANTHIVENAGYNNSRGIRVHTVASSVDGTPIEDWSSQFFVYTPNYEWSEGDQYRFKMKVRADINTTITVQSHHTPGEYIYYTMLKGDYDVTTEWQEIVYEGVITANQTMGWSGLKTISFCLNRKKEDSNIYFDDISWEPMEVGSPGFFEWKGGKFKDAPNKNGYAVLSKDLKTLTLYDDGNKSAHANEGFVYDTNIESGYPEWINVASSISKVIMGDSFSQASANALPSQLFTNVGTPDNPCQLIYPEGFIPSPFNANGQDKSDEIIIQAYHEKGQSITVPEIVENEGINGSRCYKVSSYAEAVNDWDTQFFVTTPNFNWEAGQRYKFKMKIRADKNTSIPVQAHATPREYNHYTMLNGSYDVTTEWQEKEFEGVITNEQEGSNGMHTITFVLNALKEDNNFYIDDISWVPIFVNSKGREYVKWNGGCFKELAKLQPYYTVNYENDNPASGKANIHFYYDYKRGERDFTYSMPQEGERVKIPEVSNMVSVFFDNSFANYRPTNTSRWFANFNFASYAPKAYKFYDMENLNTSEVTDMSYMFYGVNPATLSLDLSHFDTSNAKYMRYMFAHVGGGDVSKIDVDLDLSSFTFKSYTDTKGFFEGATIVNLCLPSTLNYLATDACQDLNYDNIPCMLYSAVSPQGISYSNGHYVWRGGHFKLASGYAVLSPDRKTLTFYCDDKRGNHNNTPGEVTYSLNSLNSGVAINSNKPAWYNATIDNTNVRNLIEYVDFDESFSNFHPVTCGSWFYGLSNLTSISNIGYLKTDQVKDFALMFANCIKLTQVDVSHFDTHNAANFTSMFNNCSSLTSIDVRNFDESSIPAGYGMNSMFANCSSLESIDISNFTFRTGIITTNMLGMCKKLKTLVVSSSANLMSDEAFKNVATADSPCKLAFTEIFELQGTTPEDEYLLWKGGYFCYGDNYAQIDGNTMTFYCDYLWGTRPGLTYMLNENYDTPSWDETDNSSITEVVFDSSFQHARPTSCFSWFYQFTSLSSFKNLEYLNTSKVTNMRQMFARCTNLSSLNLKSFDTSKVTDMVNMFNSNFSLRKLDLSSFVYSEDTRTSNMLYGCSALEVLSISETAGNWHSTACTYVGTEAKPCALIAPSGLVMVGKEDHGTYFYWNGGYFVNIFPGDVNGDGMVSVADVMMTVAKVQSTTPSKFIERNADVNFDGSVSISDVMGIVNIMLGSTTSSVPSNARTSFGDTMALTAHDGQLTLHLNGTGIYSASQMTVSLPEGCVLEQAEMVEARSNGHTVLSKALGGGKYRLVVFSTTGQSLGNACSDLLQLKVSGHLAGDITVSDIQMVDAWLETVLLSDVNGIATGIDNVITDSNNDGDWYNVQGQKVSNPRSGVFINNGRKVVVK